MIESMTVIQLVQFYAPLAGLLGVVFWLGVLSQKVKGLQQDVEQLKSDGGQDGDVRKLVTLEVQMTSVIDKLGGMERAMQGVQRQLANIVTKPGLHEFGADHG